MPRLLATLIAALIALRSAAPARAADVRLEVSDSTVYVGVPFTVSIVLENVQEYDPPTLPAIPGLKLVGGPNVSTQKFIGFEVGGQSTQRASVTLTWQLVAEREGIFSIPALTVTADGREFRTTAQVISAEKPQSGGQLFAEVRSDRNTYYLGETVELTLEIWVAPFVDGRLGGRLGAQAMFDQVSLPGSQFGPFAAGLRNISVREAQRAGDDGRQHAYFVYVLRASVSPRQAGPMKFDDIRILMQYPVSVRQRRGFLQDNMFETRTVVGTVQRAAIEIRDPPQEGRPPSFSGAVGRFDFSVAARPTDVSAGDPITLTMTIDDRSAVPVDMDVLQPPDLEKIEPLARDFRVAPDPPAGTVQGRRKTFTQTVRAKGEQVQIIPAVPFSYFDPQSERYVTDQGKPIPLHVRAGAALPDSQIVGGPAPLQPRITELTEVEGGILANYSGDELLASQGLVLGPAHAAAILCPPGLWALLAAARWHAARRRGMHGRRRRAAGTALKRLHAARGSGPASEAQEAAAALRDYVAQRADLAVGALTGDEAVARLRGRVPRELADEIEALLAGCERVRYSGEAEPGGDNMAQRAAGCVKRLERERFA